ncbi:MAG: DNA/RNA non-specific endonuclease [Flavobacteriaceae bacterium]
MTKKQIYTILSVLVVIIFYILNDTVDQHLKNQNTQQNTDSDLTSNLIPSSTTGDIIHHQYYSLSYNEAHEQAEWVAYELNKSHLSSNQYKRPYFISDQRVTTKSADWRNYKNSGYDKGHLCPAADRKFSKTAHDNTFLTSNITPQRHDFNSGIWNRLEQKTRYWANKYSSVYVITGGILNNAQHTIGHEKVTVPDYFYKILYTNKNNSPKMIAFLLPHKESNAPLYKFTVSVDEIEALTGIDFFEKLEDSEESKLEASNNYFQWNF